MATTPFDRTEQELAALFASYDQRGNNGWQNANAAFGNYGDKTAFNGTIYDGGSTDSVDTAGMQYAPIYRDGDFDPSTGWRTQILDGFRSADGRLMANGGKATNVNGSGYTEYGLDGKARKTGTWEDISATGAGMEFAQMVALAAGGYLGGSALAASGVGGVTAGGAGGLGTAGGASGAAGGLAGAGGAAAGLGGTGVVVGAPMATGTAVGTALPSMGAMGGVAGGAGAATAGGLFGTGITAQQALGLGTTLMGAVGGSKGQKADSTSTRTLDPRMDGLAYGEGGIVPRTYGLLQASQSPEALARIAATRAKASSLLSTPVRGNQSKFFNTGY